MDRYGTRSAVSALTVISTSRGSQLSPGSLSSMYLKLRLGVGEGAVITPGAAAVLSQVPTQAAEIERGQYHHQPIRGQCPSQVITTDQSEASILVT